MDFRSLKTKTVTPLNTEGSILRDLLIFEQTRTQSLRYIRRLKTIDVIPVQESHDYVLQSVYLLNTGMSYGGYFKIVQEREKLHFLQLRR